jgi:predicted  nucleic acid-binding Zn-ribbon protein
MEELYNSNATLITLEDQLKKTTTDGQKAVIKFKIETLKTEIAKFESIVKMYNSTVETLTTEITDLESGKTTIEMTTEITKVELEMQKLMIEASLAMTRLPLFTTELEDSRFGISSSTSASVSHHCGVYSGVTIKGDIGGTSSSTTTSSDINSQIIEKEEYAQKLREEYTKIKEVTIVQKEEIYESITSEKKIIEETEKVISENKSKLTSLRQKEKELNTKITTATESSEIETYKHELTSLIS